jgi:hypothetical protein
MGAIVVVKAVHLFPCTKRGSSCLDGGSPSCWKAAVPQRDTSQKVAPMPLGLVFCRPQETYEASFGRIPALLCCRRGRPGVSLRIKPSLPYCRAHFRQRHAANLETPNFCLISLSEYRRSTNIGNAARRARSISRRASRFNPPEFMSCRRRSLAASRAIQNHARRGSVTLDSRPPQLLYELNATRDQSQIGGSVANSD